MILRALRSLTPGRLLGGGGILLLVTAGVLWLWPSDQYLLLPDPARPVAPLVVVQGGKDPSGPGGIYYDAVIIRRAKLFEQLFHFVHSGETLVPARQVNPPGVSDRQRRQEELREMARSQDIAGAVALRYLGYKVTVRSTGALVDGVIPGSPAAKAGLQPTEVIVGVDGSPVGKTSDLRRLVSKHKPGEIVRLTVRSGKDLRRVDVRTAGSGGRTVIGVYVLQATEAKTPISIRIDAGSVGGPSAGLAFALQVLEELGHDVDRGYKVAATGQIEPEGTVLPIGGVKQKAIGVRRAGVDVFLVPAGDNAKEARKWAGPVRVIAVDSFRQALQALATLPPKT
ncbi:MAG TPA: PDZ domain-containing protein [Gaiellaceae bacterium]|nr:PDZ domain-containing protein [Gaiellaceae bacterium]